MLASKRSNDHSVTPKTDNSPTSRTKTNNLRTGKSPAKARTARARTGSAGSLVKKRLCSAQSGPGPAQNLTFSRYALMRKAGELAGQNAVARCSTIPAPGNAGRPGYSGSKNGSPALWRGLSTCKNVNICPTCANIRAKENIAELNIALSQATAKGYFPALVTGTLNHKSGETLNELLEDLSCAWAAMHRRRAWRELKLEIGYIGTITAIETTWGQENGWHPHVHAILLLKDDGPNENAKKCESIRAYYADQWIKESALKNRELPSKTHGITVVYGHKAGTYIAKMGLSSELASAVTKEGREGRYTPWQLLRESMPKTPEAEKYGHKFREYAKAFRGRLTLRWTPGLRDLLGTRELVAEAERQAESQPENQIIDVMTCTAMEMRAICDRRAHQRILDVINNVHSATKGRHQSIVSAVRHELDIIIYEYISGFRQRAGLRPLSAQPIDDPEIPGYIPGNKQNRSAEARSSWNQ